MALNGKLARGIVTAYDAKAMTATVMSYNGTSIMRNVICPFDRYDPYNGAYSITPPSLNSPCLYTEINGEYVILCLYSPVNLNSATNAKSNSSLGSYLNRTPSDMLNNNTMPGNTTATNAMGSEETFTDMMKRIIMAPGKLSSVWTLLNCVWENVCSIFRLRAGGVDVLCEVDQNNNTNTTINVRRTVGERTGTSVINLQMGQTAGIITLNINGNEFLHVDADRNTTITAKQVVLNGTDIIFNGETFNCLNVDAVKLP